MPPLFPVPSLSKLHWGHLEDADKAFQHSHTNISCIGRGHAHGPEELAQVDMERLRMVARAQGEGRRLGLRALLHFKGTVLPRIIMNPLFWYVLLFRSDDDEALGHALCFSTF